MTGRAGLWRLAEIGYAVHPDHRGQGFARETVAAIVDAGFAKFPELDALMADIDPAQTALAALLARRGFREVDRVANNVEIGGAWCDSAFWRRERPAGPRRPSPRIGPSAAG